MCELKKKHIHTDRNRLTSCRINIEPYVLLIATF